MATVRQLLAGKSGEATYSVTTTDTIYHSLEVMAKADISALLVTEGDKIVGIVTERDYARKVALHGIDASKTPVSAIMTREMIAVKPDMSVEQCMELMTRYHIRHLPVVDKDQVVGILSMRDVIDAVIENKESTIKGLENYIMGSGFHT